MKTMHHERSVDQIQGIDLYLDLAEDKADVEGHVLSYFVSIWLMQMGYGQRRTKKEVGKMASIYLKDDQVLSFMRMYCELNEIPLSKKEKKAFFVKVCQNGWLYFIRFTVKNGLCGLKCKEKMDF